MNEMDMIKKTVVASTALVLASVGAANAVTITGALTVTLSSFDGNLPTIVTAPANIHNTNGNEDIQTVNGDQSPSGTDPVFGTISKSSSTKYTSNISLNLSVGPITTFNFLQIDPPGTCGWGCTSDYALYQDTGKIDTGTVTVTFLGTGNDKNIDFTDTGTFIAKYSGATLTCAAGDLKSVNKTDCIQWATPAANSFAVSGDTLTINLVNAVDWDLIPQINLGLQSTQLITTPLPATLPLFVSGLGILGWFKHKRKRKFIGG